MAAQVYGNRWQIVRQLGEGGQAHAFIVRDLQDASENWVLKRLKNPKRLGRFEQEVEALNRLDSPRIPKIVAFSVEEPAYLVYPYLGVTLQQVVQEENPLFDDVFDYFRDVVEATQAAHAAGIVHRDIKPDNVVVDSSTPKRRAYLIDFGICQFINGGLYQTTVDEPFGNRNFAAPELELGSGTEPTTASDVYSLGKLLYWCVTGGEFFPRENLTEQRIDKIPSVYGVTRSFIRRLIEAMVAEAPSRRIASSAVLGRVERDGVLMRLGVNSVGAKDQSCPVCKIGVLRRRPILQGVGVSTPGQAPAEARILHCSYCGYLQLHDLRDTTSLEAGLWEI